MTTVAEALRRGESCLAAAGLDSTRLQARRMLAQVVGVDSVGIYQRLLEPLTSQQLARFEDQVTRRAAGEPLAYLVGSVDFAGRSFLVDERVLVPRPETEELLELALGGADRRAARRQSVRSVVDVGTGSGVLALSLARELPEAWVVGTDRSADALAVAKLNRRRLQLEDRVDFVQCDLLSGVALVADLIVANLPYVPTAEIDQLQPEVRREPRLALDGGTDGFKLYQGLLDQTREHLADGGMLIAEIGADQGERASQLARRVLPLDRTRVLGDLTGRDRFLIVERGNDTSDVGADQPDWLTERLV
jgi:release factor glutamine methyltransferase